MHIEQQIHFGNFRDVALNENRSLFRINARSEIFSQNFLDIGMKLGGIRIGGEGMKVGDEETTVIVVLNLNKLAQRTVVIA